MTSLQVSDLKAYLNDYGFPVMPMLLCVDSKLVVATPQVIVPEGDYTSNWVAFVPPEVVRARR